MSISENVENHFSAKRFGHFCAAFVSFLFTVGYLTAFRQLEFYFFKKLLNFLVKILNHFVQSFQFSLDRLCNVQLGLKILKISVWPFVSEFQGKF